MTPSSSINRLRKKSPSIWWLAIGYCLFYIPYSAMTKALSKGLFSNAQKAISGFELLPTVILGTVITFILIISLMDWWKYSKGLKVGKFSIPFITNKWTFFSGVATAAIIATTTLAYTFSGISIVFAALLMRGGVLIMAPLWDTYFRKKVSWYSWVAFSLSFGALLVLFSEKGGYALTFIAFLNILSYLSGYFFRLNFMTRIAKTKNNFHRYQFFIEEMLAAILVLVTVPFLFALIGHGEFMLSLRNGYTNFLFSDLAIPALIIGGLYACLYVFGTRIYLDNRENTYCIPINRCASLLAGVVASIILGGIFNASFVSTTQLWSAGILGIALLFLSYPELSKKWNHQTQIATQLFQNHLFVCTGNTSRSPMAYCICLHELEKVIVSKNITLTNPPIIWSVGLNAKIGRPMNAQAKNTLKVFSITAKPHVSRNINAEDVQLADNIWCMSSVQQQQLLKLFPESQQKVKLLNEQHDIPNPAGKADVFYQKCMHQLLGSIHQKIIQPAIIRNQL